MKVFISWSGERSLKLAEALRDWLPLVINAVEPWISSVDIAAGSRWNNEVARSLEESRVGIFCLTPENLSSTWLHFEAGAIAKSAAKSLACTLLLGLTPDQVEWPLAQFQAKVADRKQIQELVQTINAASSPVLLREDHLLRAFDKWWPELEGKIEAIPEQSEKAQKASSRTAESLLGEILGLLRAQERATDRVTEFQSLATKIYPDSFAEAARLQIIRAATEAGLMAYEITEDGNNYRVRLRNDHGHAFTMSISDADISDALRLRAKFQAGPEYAFGENWSESPLYDARVRKGKSAK